MADVKVKIGADASEFFRIMKGVRGDINGVRNMIGGLVAAGASIYGITKAFQGLGNQITTASQKAAEFEVLRVSLETLTGSAEKAEAMMATFRQESQKSPLSSKDYADAAKRLMAFGVNADDVIPILRQLGDVSMGNADQFGGLSLAIGQVMQKGRLMGGEVIQLSERGFNPLQYIAKRTGETLLQLQKRMEAGGISTEEVRDALTDATSAGGLFFRAIERGSETMQGKIAAAKDSIDSLYIAFGTGLNEGLKSGLDVINAELPKFTESFSKAGETFGTAISEAIAGDTERFEQIGNFIATVISESAKVGISRAFLEIGASSAKIMEDINPLRKIPGLREMERGSKYIGSGKEDFTASQISDAVEAARQSWMATQPTVMGYTPPTMDQIESGREAVFRATMERQNQLLEEIRKNTAGKPFPN